MTSAPNDSEDYVMIDLTNSTVPQALRNVHGSEWTGPSAAVDRVHDTMLVAATPSAAPELWSRYVDGAQESYRRHGVSSAFDIDEVASGATTALFYVVVDRSGTVLGGVRGQGPYSYPEQSHAVVEWKSSDGLDVVTEQLRARIPEGVIEMKTAWVSDSAPARVVSAHLARVAVPTVRLTGARFLLATAADHVLQQWQISGGLISNDIPPTPYPTPKYRTRLMWWDAKTIAEHARPDVYARMVADAEMLMINPLGG